MKNLLIALLVTISFVQVAFGWAGEVTGNASVYASATAKLNEKAVMELKSGDQVDVLKESAGKYQIKHYSGKKGWVEKSKVRKAQNIGGGTQLSFDGENIMGELGEIEGVFLFEDDNNVSNGLKVERSFKDEMNAPEDKEDLERKHTEYIKW